MYIETHVEPRLFFAAKSAAVELNAENADKYGY